MPYLVLYPPLAFIYTVKALHKSAALHLSVYEVRKPCRACDSRSVENQLPIVQITRPRGLNREEVCTDNRGTAHFKRKLFYFAILNQPSAFTSEFSRCYTLTKHGNKNVYF